jgi:hypothetical protein
MPIRGIEFHKESTDQWVSASDRDPADEDGLRLLGAGSNGVLTVMYSDIPGNSWNQNRLDKFAERAQQLIDVRIPLTDPSLIDDPAGPNGSDPARPDFFWDSGDLVARSVIIEDVTFVDEQLNFTLRKAK